MGLASFCATRTMQRGVRGGIEPCTQRVIRNSTTPAVVPSKPTSRRGLTPLLTLSSSFILIYAFRADVVHPVANILEQCMRAAGCGLVCDTNTTILAIGRRILSHGRYLYNYCGCRRLLWSLALDTICCAPVPLPTFALVAI